MKRSIIFLPIALVTACAISSNALADDVAAIIIGYGSQISSVKGYPGWGETEDVASARAKATCERLASKCGEGAESTDDLDKSFVIVCCNKPDGEFTCGVEAGYSIDQIRNQKTRTFSSRGFGNCQVPDVISARDGKSLLNSH